MGEMSKIDTWNVLRRPVEKWCWTCVHKIQTGERAFTIDHCRKKCFGKSLDRVNWKWEGDI